MCHIQKKIDDKITSTILLKVSHQGTNDGCVLYCPVARLLKLKTVLWGQTALGALGRDTGC